jgi:RNA polymerase sigma-70 factor, ECF subfamily
MNQLQQGAISQSEGAAMEFETLVLAIRPELHRYCARMTGSVIDGEDVVQETLVKAFAALKLNPPIPNLRAWLFRIAHNASIDYTRDYARRFSDPLDDYPELPSPFSELDARVAAEASLRLFVGLPPAQRAAVILKDVLGYTVEEIAEILGRSVAMVKGVLHRGRASLRMAIEDPARETAGLDGPQSALLKEYVRHFNAREFDRLREMLARDVSLDVVGVAKAKGAVDTGQYFGRYSNIYDWSARVGMVDGRPAVLVFSPKAWRKELGSMPKYFVDVEWEGSKIARIKDFRYVPYIMVDATAQVTVGQGDKW